MALELMGRDVFIRHTGTNGKSYVQQHRCWDADLFLASQRKAADDVNAKEADPKKRTAKVEQITDSQYHQERNQ